MYRIDHHTNKSCIIYGRIFYSIHYLNIAWVTKGRTNVVCNRVAFSGANRITEVVYYHMAHLNHMWRKSVLS